MGGGSLPVFFAGPCVIESRELTLQVAREAAAVAARVGLPFVFKASYDKANRTSLKSFRGPGLERGLQILSEVRRETGAPLLTDTHTAEEAAAAGEVVDVIQIPAFLCRQTDLLTAAARTGKVVNVKKGQFLAPEDVRHIFDKLTGAGCRRMMITERGTFFGYHQLVVDYVGLVKLRELGWPVVMDATHSVQSPGGLEDCSGGSSRYAPYLAWAAAAVGVDGLFIETHPDPASALSDGPNMIPLNELEPVLRRFKRLWESFSQA